ncbi:hypothetical protein ACJMK2_020498, partial [Sinanodonta woodiana]
LSYSAVAGKKRSRTIIMGCNTKIIKAFLAIVNVVYFICGTVLIGVGVWMVVDKVFVSEILGSDLFSVSSYIAIISGVILVIISFLGCGAAFSGRRPLCLVYLIILICMFVLLMMVAVLAAIFQDEMETGMQQRMEVTLKDKYGTDPQATDSWDILQSKLECCAVTDRGWSLYYQSRWYQNEAAKNPQSSTQKYVPITCCVYEGALKNYRNADQCQSWNLGPPNPLHSVSGSAKNDFLFYKGCYTAAREFVFSQSTVMLGIGFSFCFTMLFGMFLSIWLYRRLGQEGRQDFAEDYKD